MATKTANRSRKERSIIRLRVFPAKHRFKRQYVHCRILPLWSKVMHAALHFAHLLSIICRHSVIEILVDQVIDPFTLGTERLLIHRFQNVIR